MKTTFIHSGTCAAGACLAVWIGIGGLMPHSRVMAASLEGDPESYRVNSSGNTVVPLGNTPSYQSTVPSITSSRWLAAPAAVPVPGPVNRATYLTYIQRIFDNQRPYALSIAGRNDTCNQPEYARREAFFYRITGNSDYARKAMTFLKGSYSYYLQGPYRNEPVSWDALMAAGQAYLWIKDCPALTSLDRLYAKACLLTMDSKLSTPLEYGAMNRAVGRAAGRAIVALLYPTDVNNAARQAYVQQVFDDWWQLRDTVENCTPYNSLTWNYITLWLAATQQEALYQDPDFKALTERYLAQATPIGIIPDYGDTVGQNSSPGHWIALLEKWATVYRDGRYKWAAHRLFEWTVARENDMNQWGNITIWMMESLMNAYLASDDTVAEVQPDIASTLTWRKAMIFEPFEDQQTTHYGGRLVDQDIPDKLVLRDGWDPEDMYALVEAAPQDAHGHGDTGAINCMTAHGSLLLGTPSYLVKDHRFHNAFQIVRPGIPTYDGPALAAMQTTVPVLDDGQQAAYTQVHIDGYMGENASLDRRIFFVKGMLMWVQDTLTPDETMQAQVGPAWQTVAIYPTRGTNWVNTCLITSPLAYIWEQKYLMQWSNLPWDLLVVFLPDGQSTMRIDDVTIDNTQMVTPQPLQNTMKYRLWYQKDTTLQAGIPVRYNSVLLPHAPQQDCTALAAMHSLVLDSADNTMLRITLSTTRSIFLGINDGGNLINTNGIATNARRFLVDVDQTAGVSYWIVDASILITNNKLHFFSGSRRQSKEVVR